MRSKIHNHFCVLKIVLIILINACYSALGRYRKPCCYSAPATVTRPIWTPLVRHELTAPCRNSRFWTGLESSFFSRGRSVNRRSERRLGALVSRLV